jgi:ATP-dependent DNA helicase DinG
MRCPSCFLELPYLPSYEFKVCNACATPLKFTVQDFLEFGKDNIVNEKRPGQIALAKDIEDVLTQEEPRTLLIEGGTGIGKSYCYLIPSLLSENQRIVISTAKKNLQNQLFHKDLSFLQERMGIYKRIILYKGNNNYACWKLANNVPSEDRYKFEVFIEKAQTAGRPADFDNWEGPKPTWIPYVSVENCVLSTRCKNYMACRVQPKMADIIITNHNLLSLDLKLSNLFGKYSVLIVDEAHNFPEIVRETFKIEGSEGNLEWIERSITNDTDILAAIDSVGINVDKISQEFKETKSSLRSLIKVAHKTTDKNTYIVDIQKIDAGSLAENAKELTDRLTAVNETLLAKYIKDTTDNYFMSEGHALNIVNKIRKAIKNLENYTQFTTEKLITNSLLTLKKNSKGYLELQLQPVEIGKNLNNLLNPISKKIFLSASLDVNDDFKYFNRQLGAENPIKKIYPTPFNMTRQAVLYTPLHIPLPVYEAGAARDKWLSAVSDEIIRMTTISEGAAFVLFTSQTDMNDIFALTHSPLKDNDLNLLKQNNTNFDHILNQFKTTERSVLYGMKKLWEGVDVPGNKLRLVIITKLPFPPKNDPVTLKLEEIAKSEGRDGFKEIRTPKMLFELKQGAGRLIRTERDHGVIAILDSRVHSGTSNISLHQQRIEIIRRAPDRLKNSTKNTYGERIINTLNLRTKILDFTDAENFVKPR